jgi:hypothetical protein
MKTLYVSLAVLLGAAAPVALQAQNSTAAKLSVTPYAGYLSSGTILDGPLGTSLRTAGAPVYGAQLGVSLMPGVSLVGNLGYSSSKLEAGLPILGGISLTNSSIWMYDAGVQLGGSTAGGGKSISPFVQVGAGAMRYSIGGSLLSAKATNFAANAGVGADLRLSPQLSLRLMAKDYIGKFDIREAAFVDMDSPTSHNVALSAGVKLEF